jgi:hypothetical protein
VSDDLLVRLQRLYGRAFLCRLVAVGEEAQRIATQGGKPSPEIVARITMSGGSVTRTMVEVWRPV